MSATDPADETDLDSAFEESPEWGIEYLDGVYQERILRYIKRVSRGLLDWHDQKVAYQETVIGVLERARRPGFDPCRSLRMVFAIAKYKTFDILRERGHRINLDEDAILAAVAADTKSSDLILQWRLHVFPAEQRELREILLEFIATLPERQRIVSQCFVDNYEDFRERDTYQPLAAAVSAVTKIAETVASVKSAWQAAKVKIIAELHRRGYTYIKVE